ncbi:MAG: efflux RND transporter periplasmic adaptor subunit [Alcanivoracaceae bacterium]|nr:efflux RND transporter periplasmic adaptor subunit [Alcanivoracaceae bacterium]
MKKLYLITTLIFTTAIFAQAAKPPVMPPKPVVIDLVKESEVVPTMAITGNVFSINNLQFTSAVTGQLEFVAEPGTLVQVGDLIAKIDTIALDLQLLEQQELITRAKAQFRYLETNLKRQKNLVRAKSVSANSVEQIESQRDVAASDLKVAQLRVKQIEDQLTKSEIKAQYNGVVTERLRREGETVSAGTIIGSFVDLNNTEIRVQLPLRYASFVQIGQSIDIHAYGVTQKGQVKSLVPGSNNRNQAYEMRIAFEQQNVFKIGQLVSVAIPMQLPHISLMIHQDALVLREEGSFVFRVNEDNKVEKIMVKTSVNLGHLIAVEGDLHSGDQLVIRGAETLQDGWDVVINEPKSKG